LFTLRKNAPKASSTREMAPRTGVMPKRPMSGQTSLSSLTSLNWSKRLIEVGREEFRVMCQASRRCWRAPL